MTSEAAPTRDIVVLIPQRSILEYLLGRRVLGNVPSDARLKSMWMVPKRMNEFVTVQWLALRLAHESFAPVEPGRRLPFVKARFRRLGSAE